MMGLVREMGPLISGKSRVVKYFDLARIFQLALCDRENQRGLMISKMRFRFPIGALLNFKQLNLPTTRMSQEVRING